MLSTWVSFSTVGFLLSQMEVIRAQSQASGFQYLNNSCPKGSPIGRRLQRAGGGDRGGGFQSADTVFCGMLFRNIANPTYLANWRAIQARSSDIWFATLPPSGSAKSPALNFISQLVGGVQVSGHTEFYNWESDPAGSSLKVGSTTFAQFDGRRIIGTHVPFEWLPTSVLHTAKGKNPCKVIYLVREPKQNFVHAALFGGGVENIAPSMSTHIAAVLGTGDGELGTPNRGYAAYANGYAAAVGGGKTDVVKITSNGGPDVFLLSQARLADSSTVRAEVARLVQFLGVANYKESDSATAISVLQQGSADAVGNVSLLTAGQTQEVDETFAAPRVDPRLTALYTSSTTGAEGSSGAAASTTIPTTSNAHTRLKHATTGVHLLLMILLSF